jgi:SAM-dependent methyltransferase
MSDSARLERYDAAAARHYAAYRPPLHAMLLDRALPRGSQWDVGLDVGCGTGRSTTALAAHCQRVIGVDASPSMLDAALTDPRARYVRGTERELAELPEAPYDVVTFAGSLPYMKTERLRRALHGASRADTTIVVYDFVLRLDALMQSLALPVAPMVSDYDYTVNLDDWAEYVGEAKGAECLALTLTAEQVAHLVLSDSHRHDALRSRAAGDDPFVGLRRELQARRSEWTLEADIYFARYRVIR